MSGPHTRAAATAVRQIKKHGRPVALVSLLPSGSGARTWPPTEETVEQLLGVTALATHFKAHEIDGTRIKASDRRYLVDAAVEPSTEMRLREYGEGGTVVPLNEWVLGEDVFGEEEPEHVDYAIVDVKEVKPGTTGILYRVAARL